ncbi:hypothetical protein [Fontivita pretiosa]|uniref:hypothetical protein n=1 Tax=Fontivita pretiosa TaxID=2989684 RepID=UPI003D1629EB
MVRAGVAVVALLGICSVTSAFQATRVEATVQIGSGTASNMGAGVGSVSASRTEVLTNKPFQPPFTVTASSLVVVTPNAIHISASTGGGFPGVLWYYHSAAGSVSFTLDEPTLASLDYTTSPPRSAAFVLGTSTGAVFEEFTDRLLAPGTYSLAGTMFGYGSEEHGSVSGTLSFVPEPGMAAMVLIVGIGCRAAAARRDRRSGSK